MEPNPTYKTVVDKFAPRPIAEVLGENVSCKLARYLDAILVSGYGRVTLVIRGGKVVQIERTVQELPEG